MIEWIAKNWQHEWLGNFAWWQALAGVVQALVAFLLFRVTRDLATLGLFQSKLQKQSLKIALFQKRLDAFLSLMRFLAKGNAELDQAFQLLRDTNAAEFLFGPEVQAFIEKVYHHTVRIHSIEAQVNSGHDAARIEALSSELAPLQDWLASTAFREAKELFGPYLAFGDRDWEEPAFLTLASIR